MAILGNCGFIMVATKSASGYKPVSIGAIEIFVFSGSTLIFSIGCHSDELLKVYGFNHSSYYFV